MTEIQNLMYEPDHDEQVVVGVIVSDDLHPTEFP